MPRLFILSLLVLLCISSSFSQSGEYVSDEILVRLKSDVNASLWMQKKNILRSTPSKVSLRETLSTSMNIVRVGFDADLVDARTMLNHVLADPAVETAQFNHYIKLRSTVPDDPRYNLQWQYNNTGQDDGKVGADIDADLAWSVTQGGLTPEGDTIVVCVIDGGFDIDHEDVKGNIWKNHAEIPNNGIDDDNNGYVDDYDGWNVSNKDDEVSKGVSTVHGTSVMGIVGAEGNNAIGVAGVNWKVKMMLVSGGSTLESEVLAAYAYPLAARKRYNETNGKEGAYVVATNASWGVDFGKAEDYPLWCAFYDTLGSYGILNVAATINDDINVEERGDMPTTCTSDYLLSVTNVTRNDKKEVKAGYGAKSIDMGAFGSGVYTTATGSSYRNFTGTSAAAPHVAGAIALLYSSPCQEFNDLAKASPAKAALAVKRYIMDSGNKNPSLSGKTVSGKRLNLNTALEYQNQECGYCPPPGNRDEIKVSDATVTLSWEKSDDVKYVLRYRNVKDTAWIVKEKVLSPYILKDLQPCTRYEYQIGSQCDALPAKFSFSKEFSTKGCCMNPENVKIQNVDDTSVAISWEFLYGMEGYSVKYKTKAEEGWTIATITDTVLVLSGLETCAEYQFRIKSNCSEGEIDFGDFYDFRTGGCGPCIDLPYCSAPRLDSRGEWIKRVSIGSFSHASYGGVEGYSNFTGVDSLEIPFETYKKYKVNVEVGYQTNTFKEYCNLWIDYNRDGTFSEEEWVIKNLNESELFSYTLQMPNMINEGVARMRIAVTYVRLKGACSAPATDAYGEIEDYCVRLVNRSAPDCNTRISIDTIEVTDTKVVCDWVPVEGADSYTITYYEEDRPSDKKTLSAESAKAVIDGLTPCVSYLFNVKAICGGKDGVQGNNIVLKTDCVTSTQNNSRKQLLVYPNPVGDVLNVRLPDQSYLQGVLHVSDVNGVEMRRSKIEERVLTIDVSEIPSGTYFIRFISSRERVVTSKFVKM